MRSGHEQHAWRRSDRSCAELPPASRTGDHHLWSRKGREERDDRHRRHPAVRGPGARRHLAGVVRAGPCGRERRSRRRALPGRQLLARPGRVHLEPQDRRGTGGRRGPGGRDRRARRRERLPDHGARERDRRRDRGVDRVRDRDRARKRPRPPARRQGMDAAHRPRGAQGPRGEQGAQPPLRCRARRRSRTHELARGARARERGAGVLPPALRRGHRRRPGRHRPRRAAAPARRADDHRRQAPTARRSVAQPLQVALPARPVWYDHMPYIKFPENWPVFSPKDKSPTGWRCTRG